LVIVTEDRVPPLAVTTTGVAGLIGCEFSAETVTLAGGVVEADEGAPAEPLVAPWLLHDATNIRVANARA
jgi:hypothetical protein